MWPSRRLICSLIKQGIRPTRVQRVRLVHLLLSPSVPPISPPVFDDLSAGRSGYMFRNDRHTTARCGSSLLLGCNCLSPRFDVTPRSFRHSILLSSLSSWNLCRSTLIDIFPLPFPFPAISQLITFFCHPRPHPFPPNLSSTILSKLWFFATEGLGKLFPRWL